jgi:hypothetical protein
LRRRITSSPPPTTQLSAKKSSARVREPVNGSAVVDTGAAVVVEVGIVVEPSATMPAGSVDVVVDAVDDVVEP